MRGDTLGTHANWCLEQRNWRLWRLFRTQQLRRLRSDAEERAFPVTRLDDEQKLGAKRQNARRCGFPLG